MLLSYYDVCFNLFARPDLLLLRVDTDAVSQRQWHVSRKRIIKVVKPQK